ncbi:hypothetical protein Barb6XT_02381 [Bacteroidales bacterium Barb6XT]|nr:hypothetical protein Barb6XT_02381 [Bacteroidales bacterium Barb6XT]
MKEEKKIEASVAKVNGTRDAECTITDHIAGGEWSHLSVHADNIREPGYVNMLIHDLEAAKSRMLSREETAETMRGSFEEKPSDCTWTKSFIETDRGKGKEDLVAKFSALLDSHSGFPCMAFCIIHSC